MLGSDVAALTGYRYSAQYSLSRADYAERTGRNRSRATSGTERSRNLEEENVDLRRRPALESASGRREYSVDTAKRGSDGQPYTPDEVKEIEELKKRDLEVRRHEQAHFRAAGRYASPPKYEFETGPDGRRYAVGGSVDIDMSEVPNDPQATLEKARIIKRAALAPEEPSAQDRKVAREAEEMAVQAQKEISEDRMDSVESHIEAAHPQAHAEDSQDISVDTRVQQVTVEPIDFAAQPFKPNMVPRYNTSRLEMGGFGSFRIEQLATPASQFAFSGLHSNVDLYV